LERIGWKTRHTRQNSRAKVGEVGSGVASALELVEEKEGEPGSGESMAPSLSSLGSVLSVWVEGCDPAVGSSGDWGTEWGRRKDR
jgi:hypothetical protein